MDVVMTTSLQIYEEVPGAVYPEKDLLTTGLGKEKAS